MSAFVTASGAKFLVLHETRNGDTIKAFFHEVHELYVKVRKRKKGRKGAFVSLQCILVTILTDLVALFSCSC